ncbi:MAG: leucine-rich repeat domain-containing protein, partial [Gracilibacteraceae bacterium]|nr:leucine-rich repeat domain-containing protein [Gracilibacteraceae bacterium]
MSAAPVEDFVYTVSADAATITRYKGPGGDVEIPAELGGVAVKSIGASAFYRCTGLTSIAIPAGVKTIGEAAFSDCTGLTGINIPVGVTSIGDYTFYRC